jgi:hypothetical protein
LAHFGLVKGNLCAARPEARLRRGCLNPGTETTHESQDWNKLHRQIFKARSLCPGEQDKVTKQALAAGLAPVLLLDRTKFHPDQEFYLNER